MSEIADKVKKIVVEHLGVEESKVTPEASFIDDLGADSLDNVELVMAFEEEFDIEIPDDAAETIRADAALSADVLRLANSPLFGLGQPANSILHAVVLLGLNRIVSFVITAALRSFGNPARGDDGLGPALAAAIEELGIPHIEVDANYQLTVEDAAEIAGYDAVVFADAATQGPTPFWFSRVDDTAIKRVGDLVGSIGWTSHSVSPLASLCAVTCGAWNGFSSP